MPDSDRDRFSRRTRTLEVRREANDAWRFRSVLLDESFGGNYEPRADHVTVHEFELAGTLFGPDLVLTALDVSAVEHPFADCPGAIAASSQLVGRSLLSGWRAGVLEHLHGVGGCTHITTLLLGLTEATTLVYFQRLNEHAPYSAAARTSGRWIAGLLDFVPALRGACHALRAGGAAILAAETVQAAAAETHHRPTT